jgi:hypothetical protein
LSALADRFGLWGKPGTPSVAWDNWANFVTYRGKFTWFLPGILIQAAVDIAGDLRATFCVEGETVWSV